MVRVPLIADQPLPPEGITEVLILAAQQHPIIALLIVGIIICAAIWIPCEMFVKLKQADVLKSPEAAKAMIEVEKIKNRHKKEMYKIKKGK